MKPERLSNPKHPAQKPVAILRKMIEIASNENDIVFDPFMGVGSTGVAALDLNRRFIGIELDEAYFEAAKKRIATVMAQGNLFAIPIANIHSQSQEASAYMASEPIDIPESPIRELHKFFGVVEEDISNYTDNKNITIKFTLSQIKYL
jgi:hypothetical protein